MHHGSPNATIFTKQEVGWPALRVISCRQSLQERWKQRIANWSTTAESNVQPFSLIRHVYFGGGQTWHNQIQSGTLHEGRIQRFKLCRNL